jgi:hypothetical protein
MSDLESCRLPSNSLICRLRSALRRFPKAAALRLVGHNAQADVVRAVRCHRFAADKLAVPDDVLPELELVGSHEELI